MQNSPKLAYYLPEGAGVLQIEGADNKDFLHRQSTNDIHQLVPGKCITTVLTNPTARILDVLQVIAEEDKLLAFTLPGRTVETFNFLKKRVFFNDRVSLSDVSSSFFHLYLEGTETQEYLRNQGFPIHEVGNWGETTLSTGALDGVPAALLPQRGLWGIGYHLYTSAVSGKQIEEYIRGTGADLLSPEIYTNHRIEAGIPGPKVELTDAYTPLETGLDWAVSHTKGCYTGQEVIARQVNYDKITRLLVGIFMETPASIGSRITAEGKPAGEITSSTVSPTLGPIALAVLKRPYFTPETPITILDSEAVILGRVTALPFPR